MELAPETATDAAHALHARNVAFSSALVVEGISCVYNIRHISHAVPSTVGSGFSYLQHNRVSYTPLRGSNDLCTHTLRVVHTCIHHSEWMNRRGPGRGGPRRGRHHDRRHRHACHNDQGGEVHTGSMYAHTSSTPTPNSQSSHLPMYLALHPCAPTTQFSTHPSSHCTCLLSPYPCIYRWRSFASCASSPFSPSPPASSSTPSPWAGGAIHCECLSPASW